MARLNLTSSLLLLLLDIDSYKTQSTPRLLNMSYFSCLELKEKDGSSHDPNLYLPVLTSKETLNSWTREDSTLQDEEEVKQSWNKGANPVERNKKWESNLRRLERVEWVFWFTCLFNYPCSKTFSLIRGLCNVVGQLMGWVGPQLDWEGQVKFHHRRFKWACES